MLAHPFLSSGQQDSAFEAAPCPDFATLRIVYLAVQQCVIRKIINPLPLLTTNSDSGLESSLGAIVIALWFREHAMHKSRLGEVTIDCRGDDLETSAAFWGAVFGYEVSGFEDHYVLKTPEDEVLMNIQAVDHPPRVHLDIETDDIEAEVSRLEKLGARRLKQGRRWWVMEAPTGHRFCVAQVGRHGFDQNATQWE